MIISGLYTEAWLFMLDEWEVCLYMIIPSLMIILEFSLCHVKGWTRYLHVPTLSVGIWLPDDFFFWVMGRFNTSIHGLRISTLKSHVCSTLPNPIFYIQSKYTFRLLFELQIARMTYTQSIWLVKNVYLYICTHNSLHQ